MKFKLFYILIVLSFFSCADELEILPNSSLSEQTAYKNVADLQTALNASYSQFTTTPITFNSIFTDNTKIGAFSGGQQTGLHGLVMNADNGTARTLWTTRYGAINRATRVIRAVDEKLISFDESEQAEVNSILGQAYALRALAHFELYQYFTPSYADQGSLSVPVITTIVSTEDNARNTVGEVIAQINNDLTTAQGLLTDESNNEYITEDFITALNARVALYTQDYSKAITEADKLIAKYALANKVQYANMFLDRDDTEVIFKFARVNGDAGIGNIWRFTGGNSFIEASSSLVDVVSDNDVRKNVLFSFDAANGTQDINKYPGTGIEFLADYKYFRVSEMYLIKAEAQIQSDNLSGAKSTLAILRNTRITDAEDFDLTSKAQALDFLLNERRVELAYEGQRYLDLKRLGVALQRADADCGNLSNACSIAVNDRRFTLPIPHAEMDANKSMVQNPGY